MQEFKYARFLRRAQAVSIDGVIIPLPLWMVIVIASDYGFKGELIALMAAGVFFVFEPFMVSAFGATFGQKIVGIEVRNMKTGKKLNIFAATLRFIVKILLGWVSLVTIFSTKFHQAVHDSLVGSIVILKSPESKPGLESQSVRVFEEPGYNYPSGVRKFLVAITYNIILLSLLLLIISTNYFLSQDCYLYNLCNTDDYALVLIFEILWLMGIPYTIIMCRKGRLFGCRRKPIENAI